MKLTKVVTSEFLEKATKCKHKNLSPNYFEAYKCDTPYCYSEETHCLDCGTYFMKCGCGFMNGMSGWPEKRHRNHRRKKNATINSRRSSSN